MADNLFKLIIISPDRVFYEGDVEMVEVRATEGDMGILKGHIPLTAIVAPGALKIHEVQGIKEAALHDGFIEVLKDKMTIMAESCEWPDEIDLNRAQEAKVRAERRITSGDADVNVHRAELALRRSLTRISLAEKYTK